MVNLANFTGDFEGMAIRVTEDGRFSVYDVLVAFGVCGIKDCRNVFKRIGEKNPEVLTKVGDFRFSGQGQQDTPVATQSVCEEILILAGKHPDQKAATSDKFFPRTESQIFSVLKEAFLDLNPISQFQIHGYRIDLYLATPNIAIEVDEDAHNHYRQHKEMERVRIIMSALGCSFVQFNPYDPKFNLGTVIRRIRGLS